jgi:RNA polymerase sigma factor (sigma-70 family)
MSMSRLPVPTVSREVAFVDELETELVLRARQGDPAAGPFLVSYLGDHLLGYARAITPDLGDTDRERIIELAIEAGVRAIDRFDPFRGSLRVWFRQQVRWKVAEWRRSGPPPTVDLPPELSAGLEDVAPLRASVAEAIRAAIAKLGPDDRVVLALRLVESLEHAEIAQRINITTEAARQRYLRARRRLREGLEGQPELVSYLKERGVL